jgi:hypothetical protein
MQRKTWYSILGVDAKPLSTEFGMLRLEYLKRFLIDRFIVLVLNFE